MMIKKKNEKQNKGLLSTRKGQVVHSEAICCHSLPLSSITTTPKGTPTAPRHAAALIVEEKGVSISDFAVSKQEEKIGGGKDM